MNNERIETLIEEAFAARKMAYTPCGVCRQVMKEFCHEDAFQIILARSVKEYKVYTLAELLPMGFGPDNLQ